MKKTFQSINLLHWNQHFTSFSSVLKAFSLGGSICPHYPYIHFIASRESLLRFSSSHTHTSFFFHTNVHRITAFINIFKKCSLDHLTTTTIFGGAWIASAVKLFFLFLFKIRFPFFACSSVLFCYTKIIPAIYFIHN